MGDAKRFKDYEWTLDKTYGYTYDLIKTSILMDIRDVLQEIRSQNYRLLAIVECRNFTNIPKTLSRIARNTARHRCLVNRCPRTFDTARGLAQHERIVHK